ncbi:hypothetical protein ABT56_16420 [Photobacterium aquae]|uniref:Uncharacterized protein n=1 Tax=Photobacterium aquae TaxID=1195763 RepID=A0A0J1GX07_9GAMM|nr:hypothetical protein [Photobacterium aquae]KLV04190.1 hypothetical protein ABT56_16420 [Photobacterium aquae]
MFKEKLGIPKDHKLIRTDMKWDEGKKVDVDTFWYDERDVSDDIVAKYIIKVTKYIYPPKRSDVTFQKYTADSLNLLATGDLPA